jgi:hypothetical protein
MGWGLGRRGGRFLIIKRIFGFVKTRYKGLAKNAHRL